MTDSARVLAARLEQESLDNAALLRFDTMLHRAISHIAPLRLKEDLFFTCRHIHVARYRKDFELREEQHAEIEIQYLLEGEYLYETARDRKVLHPGEGLLIMAGLPHWSICQEEGAKLTAFVAINGPRTETLMKDLHMQTDGRLLPFGGTTEAGLICELFKLVLDRGTEMWQREMVGGLLQLWLGKVLTTCLELASWTHYSESEKSIASNRGVALYERAVEFIYANFPHSISVGDIARHVGITPRHLNRLFHQHSGNSVNTTLQDVRLVEAFKMINSDPTLPIKEVAYTTGFTSPSYFTQCFKRKYNTRPSDISRDLSYHLESALQRFIPEREQIVSNLEEEMKGNKGS